MKQAEKDKNTSDNINITIRRRQKIVTFCSWLGYILWSLFAAVFVLWVTGSVFAWGIGDLFGLGLGLFVLVVLGGIPLVIGLIAIIMALILGRRAVFLEWRRSYLLSMNYCSLALLGVCVVEFFAIDFVEHCGFNATRIFLSILSLITVFCIIYPLVVYFCGRQKSRI